MKTTRDHIQNDLMQLYIHCILCKCNEQIDQLNISPLTDISLSLLYQTSCSGDVDDDGGGIFPLSFGDSNESE
ncbi:hypothetical protein BLOT_001859 [Blomia tropicalis]|nr:hypothetical protein BLOT_001859 [Blomia tropicalis]